MSCPLSGSSLCGRDPKDIHTSDMAKSVAVVIGVESRGG